MNCTQTGYNSERAMIDPQEASWFQFVEAPAFTRFRENYLNDEEFSELQLYLATHPESGDLIPGGGGIRKLRWKDPRRSKGKRGGLRVIYYCFLTDQEIWLLTMYNKDEMSDLSKDEKDVLKRVLESERSARKSRSDR